MEPEPFGYMGQPQINISVILMNEFQELILQLGIMGTLAFMHHLADRLQNLQQSGFNLLKGLTGKQLADQFIAPGRLLQVIGFELLRCLQHGADQFEHQAAGQLYRQGLPGKIGHQNFVHDLSRAGIITCSDIIDKLTLQIKRIIELFLGLPDPVLVNNLADAKNQPVLQCLL